MKKPVAVALAVIAGSVGAALVTRPVPCEPFELVCRGPRELRVHARLCGDTVKVNPILLLDPPPAELHHCTGPDGGTFKVLP